MWAAWPVVAVVVVFSGSVGGAGAAVVLRLRRCAVPLAVVVAGAAARSVPLRVLRRCLPCPYAQGSEGSGPSSGSGGASISSGLSVR